MPANAYGQERKCEHLDDCEMFQLFRLTGTLAVWQERYCRGDYESCERHKRQCRGEHVQPTLLPNGQFLKKS